MPAKLVKISRKISDLLGLSRGKKIHYHLGRSNFGDDINEWFFSKLLGTQCVWGRSSNQHILGIGSIAQKANNNSIICGSGFISPKTPAAKEYFPKQIVSLRGKLSCEILGANPEYIGDPVIFLSEMLHVKRSKKFKFGFVPHVTNYNDFKHFFATTNIGSYGSLNIINPADNFEKVVQQINECEFVASQSLHGLICADSYCIPSLWIEPSLGMIGGDFKFNDYFSATFGEKVKLSLSDVGRFFDVTLYSINEYKRSRVEYKDFLRSSLSTLI